MSTPNYRLVGKWSGRRLDGAQKITGQMPYGSDFVKPNMLFMKILGSQIPSGHVTAWDTTAAKAIPGVVMVATADDIKNDPYWSKIMFTGTLPMLAYDKIRAAGEEIAAVVAEDPYAAEEACQAIKVTYSATPFVIDQMDAIQSSAPQVFDGTPNLGTHTNYTFGNVSTAKQGAGLTQVQNTYVSQTHQHFNIGPRAFTIQVDTNGLTEIWSSNQYEKGFQSAVAGWLGIAQSRVRCHMYAIGGGNGDNSGTFRCHMLGTYFSQKTGRAVHYDATREEDALRGNHRPRAYFNITTYHDSKGTVQSLEATVYNNTSYQGSNASAVPASGLIQTWKFPNFNIDGYEVTTNNWRCGAMRCPPSPHPCWAINTHLDIISQMTGVDPVTVSNNNGLYVKGDADQLTGNRIASCGQPDVFNWVVQNSQFSSKWKPWKQGTTVSGVMHGIGLASFAVGNGSGSTSTGLVYLQSDGSLQVHVNSTPLGNGRRESAAIMAGELLGMPFNMVTMMNYDSQGGTDVGMSVGSLQTKTTGNCIGAACADAKNQMMAKAATSLGTTVDKLTYAMDGSMKIFLTSDPTKYVTFASLSGAPRIIGVGTWIAPTKTTQRVFNTAVAEVDVDTDTGLVTVDNIWEAQDAGQVIFPAGIEAQIQGAIIQACAYALQEEMWPDKNTGTQYVTGYLDHKLYLANQVPNIYSTSVNNPESGADTTSFGMKGMGEPPLNPPSAAITNAIYNACGARVFSLPLTPDKILKALGKA
ncbi:MAG TPA: xanthine dehydrogenase family protein molybdopterin-binding subunit [Conexivisphaerales archaeon]|nr:xanthine dehydrogenase family protein molybdopterin-binding subunit [Conexivisphaerales archaeon]